MTLDTHSPAVYSVRFARSAVFQFGQATLLESRFQKLEGVIPTLMTIHFVPKHGEELHRMVELRTCHAHASETALRNILLSLWYLRILTFIVCERVGYDHPKIVVRHGAFIITPLLYEHVP